MSLVSGGWASLASLDTGAVTSLTLSTTGSFAFSGPALWGGLDAGTCGAGPDDEREEFRLVLWASPSVVLSSNWSCSVLFTWFGKIEKVYKYGGVLIFNSILPGCFFWEFRKWDIVKVQFIYFFKIYNNIYGRDKPKLQIAIIQYIDGYNWKT